MKRKNVVKLIFPYLLCFQVVVVVETEDTIGNKSCTLTCTFLSSEGGNILMLSSDGTVSS